MAEKILQLEDIWPLVMGLSPVDKMKLVERVAAWFEHELADIIPSSPAPTGWGAEIVQAIESGELDTSAWAAMDIADPVQWVKELRQREHEQRASRL